MRYRLLIVLIVLTVGGLAASLVAGLIRADSAPWELIRFAPRADSLVVYEGLPHQLYEQELLEQERKAKETVELKGYPFYREPLKLAPGDAQQLTAILAKHSTWRRFAGEKKCGGFHPDYAVEFRRGTDSFLILLCFGCGEAKVFGRLMESRYDVSLEPKLILERYRKNRPPSQLER